MCKKKSEVKFNLESTLTQYFYTVITTGNLPLILIIRFVFAQNPTQGDTAGERHSHCIEVQSA